MIRALLNLSLLLFAFGLNAQSTTIRFPVQTEQQSFVELPYLWGTNGLTVTNYVIIEVTNYTFLTVTNYVTLTNNPSRKVQNMPGTIIQPVGHRIDLEKKVTGPTSFWLGTFALDDDVLIFLDNPGSNTMTWPANMKLPYGPLPTNAGSAILWFKNVNGRIWASP